MKRPAYISITFAILLLVSPIAAHCVTKVVRQAEKLASQFDKLEQARDKINIALSDSLHPADAHTFYVAGKIEETAFKHYYKLLGINRNDPTVDRTKMASALMKAFNYYEAAMRLDTLRNKKGDINTHYSSRIAEWINAVTPSFYNAGIAYMNKRMFYPHAYEAFKTFALMPEKSYYMRDNSARNDSLRANAWFYAGVMAFNNDQFEHALEAFERARLLSHPKKEVVINEIICLGKLIKTDPNQTSHLTQRITELAAYGYKRFGMQSPVFIQKYVAGLLLEQQHDSAMTVIDDALQNADMNSMLHSMKAGLLLEKGDISGSATEYQKAASLPDADPTTLAAAAKTMAKEAIMELENVTGSRKTVRDKKTEIKHRLLEPALEFAIRAKKSIPDDQDIDNTIEAINYYLH